MCWKAMLSIAYWNSQGVTEWDVYEAGESLMVQPNAPHSFFNKSERPCRVLSVSTYHHERMMKDAVHPDGRTDFLPAQLTQADFEKLTKSMEKNQTFLVARPCLASGRLLSSPLNLRDAPRAVRGDINHGASLLEKAADCPRGVSGFVGCEPNPRFQALSRSVGVTSGLSIPYD